MNFSTFFCSLARKQLGQIFRLLKGLPVSLPALGSQTLEEDDIKLVRKLLKARNNWFDPEPVLNYEREFANWIGSPHAFAFMGGRVALSASIHALELQPGDEVILPGYTCVVVPNAFDYAGITTVYADIELDTYGLDADRFSEKITSKTRAVLLHHLYGLVCKDYLRIIEIAHSHNLKIIEDCAHATGAEYRGKKVGTYGDIGFYSSEQSKIWNTIQGGIVVTADSNLAKRLKDFQEKAANPEPDRIDRLLHNVLLNYYQFKHPQRWCLGEVAEYLYGDKRLASTSEEELAGVAPAYYGQKMPAAIATLGLNQLRKIDRFNRLRVDNAQRWDRWCDDNGYRKPLVIANSKPVFLRYPVLVEEEKKADRSWAVKAHKISLGVWFQTNIHPAVRTITDCPNADQAVKQCINIPTII